MVKAIIYELLTANTGIVDKLAKSTIPGSEHLPAIYDTWPQQDALMPYAILTWKFPPGRHWAQVAATLTVDIFTGSGDSTEAQDIKNEIDKVIGRHTFPGNENTGLIRTYKGDLDEQIPDDEPLITHWTADYLIKYFRNDLINHLNN